MEASEGVDHKLALLTNVVGDELGDGVKQIRRECSNAVLCLSRSSGRSTCLSSLMSFEEVKILKI